MCAYTAEPEEIPKLPEIIENLSVPRREVCCTDLLVTRTICQLLNEGCTFMQVCALMGIPQSDFQYNLNKGDTDVSAKNNTKEAIWAKKIRHHWMKGLLRLEFELRYGDAKKYHQRGFLLERKEPYLYGNKANQKEESKPFEKMTTEQIEAMLSAALVNNADVVKKAIENDETGKLIQFVRHGLEQSSGPSNGSKQKKENLEDT